MALHAARIVAIERIIRHVSVQIQIILVPHRISLQEASQHRIVDARFVVVELYIRQRDLAGVAEARAGPRIRFAVRPVAIGRGRAAVKRMRHDRALRIGVQPALAGHARAFVPHQRLVHARAMRIATRHVRADILAHQPVAIVQEVRGHAAGDGLAQAPQRIVVVRR